MQQGSFTTFRNLLPFGVMSLLWGCLGILMAITLEENAGQAIRWVLVLWSACVLDLFSLAKIVAGVLGLMSQEQLANQPALAIETLIWALAKFGSLGLLGVLLWHAGDAPQVSLLWGIATLLVVPLFGGLWWSRRGGLAS